MSAIDAPDSLASTLWGLITFETFVSPTLLIGFYYLGALGGPIVGMFVMRQLVSVARRVNVPRSDATEAAREVWIKTRAGIGFVAFFAFVMFELFWRMLFEFLLAYFQMRDALMALG